MTSHFQSAATATPEPLRTPVREPAAAVLAGARARGVADAFELLGVAAAMIDECGFALHINDKAKRLLGPQLWIDDGRLRAADSDLDEALGQAIESALAGGPAGRGATNLAFASELRGVVTLRVMPFGAGDGDAYQLLRAIVIIEEQRAQDGARRDGMN